jgi:hypothetical protein
MLKSSNQQPAFLLLSALFLSVYAFVMVSGLMFVYSERHVVPLIIAFAVQVPWVSSPLITYRLAAGFHLTVGLIGGNMTGGFNLGSDFQFYIFHRFPWGFGVNIFALKSSSSWPAISGTLQRRTPMSPARRPCAIIASSIVPRCQTITL